jgi:hypothetical protein
MPKFAPQHWRRIEAVFLAAGFKFVRQEGPPILCRLGGSSGGHTSILSGPGFYHPQ